MGTENLNGIIEQLRKMNDEVLQSRVKSNYDLKAYDDLKTQYLTRVKELEEAKKKIEHLKKLCKVLEEKLSKFSMTHSENQKLNNKVKKLERNLELVSRENQAYMKELGEVRSMLSDATNSHRSVGKIMELQRLLKEKESEYAENLDKVRSDARRSLLTLESRIMLKLTGNAEEGSVSLDEMERKIADSRCIIDVLNISNLRLKEKLELKEVQYRELEDNYLRLKVCSQSNSACKTLLSKNIENVLQEITNTKPPDAQNVLTDSDKVPKSHSIETKDFLSSERPKVYCDVIEEIFVKQKDQEQNSPDLTDDDTEESLEIHRVGFGNMPQPFEIDIGENEISVEVKSCISYADMTERDSSNSHKSIK